MKNSEYGHTPVLLNEVLHGLNIRPDGCYVDCTFGRGGHTRSILGLLGATGRMIAIDRDPEAIAAADADLARDGRLTLVHGCFAQIGNIIEDYELVHKVNGILFDLGVSSPQLDDPRRGFSFTRDAPLDMRMDNSRGVTAAEWLQSATVEEIAEVLRSYGEERYAGRIARAIVAKRKEEKILRTAQLAEVIARAAPTRERHKHPATRAFQAIRIFINQELEELQTALARALEVLAPAGRLVIISFHSLEDRMVKRFMRTMARGDDYPPGLPVTSSQLRPRLILVGKAIHPDPEEIRVNMRARSAVLRIAEKLA